MSAGAGGDSAVRRMLRTWVGGLTAWTERQSSEHAGPTLAQEVSLNVGITWLISSSALARVMNNVLKDQPTL